MEEYTSNQSVEELLEAHSRWHYDRTDRNGTRYFWDNTCPRCGGTGHLHGYEYVQGGICFKCEGSGVVEKPRTIKVYTEAYGAKLKAGREARAQQREIERLAKARASRGEWLEKFGFGNEDGTYVLYMVKGNTYSIKDELKALGCKFQPSIGWYSAQPLDGYECQRFTEDQVIDKSQEYSIVWKDKSEIEAQKEYEPSASEWVGEVGERGSSEPEAERGVCDTAGEVACDEKGLARQTVHEGRDDERHEHVRYKLNRNDKGRCERRARLVKDEERERELSCDTACGTQDGGKRHEREVAGPEFDMFDRGRRDVNSPRGIGWHGRTSS